MSRSRFVVLGMLIAATSAAAQGPGLPKPKTSSPIATTRYPSGRLLNWQAQPNIVVAGANPNDPMYAMGRGGAYDGVAALFIQRNDGNFICSGALLNGGLDVLTAAHCLADNNGKVITNSITAVFFPPGQPATVREFVTASGPYAFKVNPLYTGDVVDEHDVGVVRLNNAPSAGITRYQLFGGTASGQQFNVAGSGTSGTGNTGGIIGPGFAEGNRRQGQNNYDFTFTDPAWGGFFGVDASGFNFFGGTAGVNVLISDFDNGLAANDASCWLGGFFGASQFCHLGLGVAEVSVGGGDSGGPGFINGQIASVTSFGLTFGNSGGAPDIDNFLNDTFGEFAGYTRVDLNRTWIASVSPEPATMTLLGSALVGLAGLGVSRRRRR